MTCPPDKHISEVSSEGAVDCSVSVLKDSEHYDSQILPASPTHTLLQLEVERGRGVTEVLFMTANSLFLHIKHLSIAPSSLLLGEAGSFKGMLCMENIQFSHPWGISCPTCSTSVNTHRVLKSRHGSGYSRDLTLSITVAMDSGAHGVVTLENSSLIRNLSDKISVHRIFTRHQTAAANTSHTSLSSHTSARIKATGPAGSVGFL